MKQKFVPLFILLVMLLLVGGNQASPSLAFAPALDPLPQPENIKCQGNAADTVRVYWTDKATDEDNYRVERKIGNGSWSEVATMSPDGDGKYGPHEETGVDTSQPNHFYRVRAYRSADDSYSPFSNVCNNRRITTTDHYRFFYGLRGIDECPTVDGNDVCLADDNSSGENIYVDLQETALEGSLDAFTRLGFTIDAGTPPGSLDKIPINVVWCDGGGCAGGGGLGLSPWLMEMPFDLNTRVGDPIPWLVALHEAFHFQQFKYWGLDDPAGAWVSEGQARSIQDKICIGGNRGSAECFDDIDTGYAGYVPEVKNYLGTPNKPLNQYDYKTALFWTYLTEKFGTSDPSDDVEAGMNLIIEFWEESHDNPGRDGITVLNSTLSNLGYSETYRDIWKNFAVASYAKDLSGPGVPNKYQYEDMSQPGGNYGPVTLSLDENLALGEQVVDTDETAYQWGANYYEVRPASDVPIIDIKFTQDTTGLLYYTVLGIKGNDLAYEHNVESRHLDHTLINNNYDKVVVVVAGLENLANYRYSFNGTQPELNILSPTTTNKARVGDPAAPDKFLVQVEVIDSSGVPLAGVDINNFNFKIGTKNVPADNILTSAVVQDKYWFVLRAVTQDAATTYDFYADYSGALTDTQSDAVNYIPRTDADSVLVIDRSGSMSGDKLLSAQEAARLFVDSWRVGDKIGVISFNETPNPDLNLTNWTDTPSGGSRQDAFDAINGLTPGGGTNIGDSLRMGWDMLDGSGDSGHDWALVLLSDGIEESSDPNETFDQMINALKDATGKTPAVHTVAVGPNADRPRMQRVSEVTGGIYQFVSLPGVLVTTNGIAAIDNLGLNMDSRYRAIATDVIGQQQFYSLVGPIDDGISLYDWVEIPVENGAAELVLSFSWDPTLGILDTDVLQLRDPNDNVIPYFQTDNRHRVWRVPTPMGGTWRIYVQTYIIPNDESGKDNPQTDPEWLPPYLVQASLKSDVTMDVYLTTPEEERTPGAPIGIVASLTDTGPITGASVKATVEKPSPSVDLTTLTLYDDGQHGDGDANDGIYANKFTQTGAEGSYNVTVNASGTSPLSGPFERQALLSFHIDSEGDRDGDGLLDEWEIRFGTNPDVPDQNEDPDNDGCNNICERDKGTDPNDSDTDDGGESDNTDPNPLDPSDDATLSIWGVAYPGNEENYIKYVLRPEWDFVGFFRSVGIDGPYNFIGQDFGGDITGVYSDTMLTNGTEYCYIVEAIYSGGRRTPASPPTCVVPNTDPLPPQGYVVINDGAQTTFSTDVTLTLWASDDIDPHNQELEMFLPPSDSASGVTDMMISNYADMRDGAWEQYNTTKDWTLGQSSGLAAVFAKFRDATGNESEVVSATIHVGSGPGMQRVFLPVISR
jgi:Mg-chelatase subunit ChlD